MPSLRSFPSMPPGLEEEGHDPSDGAAEVRNSNPLGSTLALWRFASVRESTPNYFAGASGEALRESAME
jgi:hypothetical protein